MPLVRIDHSENRTELHEIADAIHRAIVEVYGIPERDRFQVLTSRPAQMIVAEDAVCSSADPTHDAVQELYHARFSQQVQTLTTAAIKELWRPAEA